MENSSDLFAHNVAVARLLWLPLIATLPANHRVAYNNNFLHNAFIGICECAFSTASTLFSDALPSSLKFLQFYWCANRTNYKQLAKKKTIKSMRKDYSWKLTFWLEWQRWWWLKREKSLTPRFWTGSNNNCNVYCIVYWHLLWFVDHLWIDLNPRARIAHRTHTFP